MLPAIAPAPRGVAAWSDVPRRVWPNYGKIGRIFKKIGRITARFAEFSRRLGELQQDSANFQED
jgi:hypothetical protein